MYKFILLLLLASIEVDFGSSFSTGAPAFACPDLNPTGHGASTANGASPYMLTISEDSYSPGDVLQVTLDGADFRGFLIVGRRANSSSNDNIGTFSADPTGESKVDCGDQKGLTQTSKSVKTSLTFNWTAPSTAEGDVEFHYIVVRGDPSIPQPESDYFGNLRSSVLSGPGGSLEDTMKPPASKFNKDPACGDTKGCYSNCENDVCDFLLAWARKGDKFEMTLKSGFSGTGDYYISLGFSNAAKMHDASVVACTAVGGKVDAFISFNPGYYNQPLPNPKEGMSSISGSYKDGILACTFERETSSANNSQIFDLTKPWHLITARGGAAADGVLYEHDGTNRFYTSSQIDFTDPSVDNTAELTEYPLVKAHACLMVLAWMLSASIGLGFARFFKALLPDHKPCGVKVWFAVHRSAMVLAFLMGIAAFVLIFVEVKGYSKITGETYKKAHPVLGIIVTSLLFINPFMSLLRCAPDDPKRQVFNWAHFGVGTSAHILAGVTITLGFYLPKAQIDKDLGLIIMIVYGSWHLVFFIIMSVLDFMSKSSKSKVDNSSVPPNTTEMTSVQPSAPSGTDGSVGDNKMGIESLAVNASPESTQSMAKKILMAVHVIILTDLTFFLVYLIIDGNT